MLERILSFGVSASAFIALWRTKTGLTRAPRPFTGLVVAQTPAPLPPHDYLQRTLYKAAHREQVAAISIKS